jgi:hypothetical protein
MSTKNNLINIFRFKIYIKFKVLDNYFSRCSWIFIPLGIPVLVFFVTIKLLWLPFWSFSWQTGWPSWWRTLVPDMTEQWSQVLVLPNKWRHRPVSNPNWECLRGKPENKVCQFNVQLDCRLGAWGPVHKTTWPNSEFLCSKWQSYSAI